jgi:hypothetical protein
VTSKASLPDDVVDAANRWDHHIVEVTTGVAPDAPDGGCSPFSGDVAFRIGPKRFDELGQFIGLRDERRDVAFTVHLDC